MLTGPISPTMKPLLVAAVLCGLAACSEEASDAPAGAVALAQDSASESGSPIDACGVLTAAEWEAVLGPAYYGPESGGGRSRSGDTVTSTCTYNFNEVLIRRPTDITDEEGLRRTLESMLEDSASVDADQGYTWKATVEAAADMGAPAVAGWVAEEGVPESESLEVWYVVALSTYDGEPVLVQVKGADSLEQTKSLMRAYLTKL